MKEELNIWTKNYVDVNALVTERIMTQNTLEKAKYDLETLRKEYDMLEVKHKNLRFQFSETKAKLNSRENKKVIKVVDRCDSDDDEDDNNSDYDSEDDNDDNA